MFQFLNSYRPVSISGELLCHILHSPTQSLQNPLLDLSTKSDRVYQVFTKDFTSGKSITIQKQATANMSSYLDDLMIFNNDQPGFSLGEIEAREKRRASARSGAGFAFDIGGVFSIPIRHSRVLLKPFNTLQISEFPSSSSPIPAAPTSTSESRSCLNSSMFLSRETSSCNLIRLSRRLLSGTALNMF